MGFLTNLFSDSASAVADEHDLSELVSDGALIIDVRTPEEFSGGHIDGALNIPSNGIRQLLAHKKTDKDQTVIVYCHSGARSGGARRALMAEGYTSVINGGSLHRMRSQLENRSTPSE